MNGNLRAAWNKKWPLFMLGVVFVLMGCASKPPAKTAAPPPGPTEEKTIHRIAVSEDEATVLVNICANRPLSYTAVKHQFPLGVVLYFPDTALKGIQDSYTPDSPLIKAIHTSKLKVKRRSSQIEISLSEDVPYKVTRAENKVLVHLKKPIEVARRPEPTVQPEKPIEVARRPEPTVQPEKPTKEKTIHRIAVSEDEATVLVNICANRPLSYTAVKHQFPLGVVLYFPDTALKGIQDSYTPDSPLIKAIHTSKLKVKTRSSRIEISLSEDVPYKVTRAEDRVLVHLKKPIEVARAPEPTVPPEKPTKVARRAEPKVPPEKPKPKVQPQIPAEEIKRPAWVNRIEFEMLEKGKSRVIVGTTRKVRCETQKISNKRLLLKLFDTRIPKFQKRPLITTRFESAVDQILPIQTPKMGDTAVIVVELRQRVPYRIEQKENLCLLDLGPSTVPPRPMAEADRPEWVRSMKEAEVAVVKEPERPPEEPVLPLVEAEKRYTGERISLDFQDADIHNIFRILHEVSGKNFVIGEDVKGRVTLKLINVPWDQVMDLILKMNKLGTVVEGNVVRIATLSTLEAEQKALKARMKAEQDAKEMEPLFTEYIPVNYADAKNLTTHLDEIKSSRGKVSVDERTNKIIIKDTAETIQNAKEIIKRLDVVTPQVVIEARIVEATTDFSREIGIQWGGQHGIQPGDPGYGIGPQRGYDLLRGTWGFTGGVGDNLVVNLPPAGPTSGIGFNFARLTGTSPLTLQANLQAMEAEGKLKIISSPRILTLDNKEAYIEQGLEIPYQVLEEGSYSLKWAAAVLKLTVTPHITMDRRVNMKIVAKKDAPDWSVTVQGAPGISKKEAATELLVNDGDTVVIGGIIVREESVSKKGVPGLSRIPVLGWLFKSQATMEEKRELLIFVTPTIVKLEEAPLMKQAAVSEAS